MLLFPRTDRRGDVALEFALVVPLMLTLMLGIIDFGWLVWTGESVQQGASAGARCMGVLAPACSSGGAFSSTATLSYITGMIASRGVTLPASATILNASTSCGTQTGFSKVSISYNFQNVVPNALDAFGLKPIVSVVACFPNQP